MAGRRAQPPRASATLSILPTGDAKVDASLKLVEQAVQALQANASRDLVQADLIVGTNRIAHGLGRAVRGYTVTATAADASFAHALDLSNPHPDREVWITVVGVAQTDAQIEVF